MAKIPYITLSDTINTSRLRINQLIDSVGDLSLLTTDDSATIVGAINFLDSNAGRKTALTTTIKTSIVAGINEHDAELGTITAAAMKTKLGASTVSGALAAISDSIGSGSLTTTTKTLVGAINEHDAELGVITTAAMKTKLGAATVSAAIAELNDSIGYGILTTTNKQLIAAINELDSNAGRKANLKTTTRTSLVAGINEIQDSIGYGGLTTTNKTVIAAINELDSNAGRKTNLTAGIERQNLVNAINFVDSNAGRKSSLKTTIRTSLVAGINEIQDSIGYGGLTTTTKTLLGAINEHDAELGLITAAALKTRGAASTVSTAIAQIFDSIGTAALTTTTKTLIGAINEHDTELGTITTAGMKTKLGAATVSAAIAELNDSIGYGILTTTNKQLIPAINELDSNAGRKANLTTLITSNLVNAINFVDSNAGRKSNLTTTVKTSLAAAINEHDAELGTITAAAMKTRGAASTVSTAIAQIFDSIGTAALTTSSKTLTGAINELKTREDTTQSHVVDSASQLLLKSNGLLSARFTNANVQFQGFVSSTTSLATTQQDYTGAINELKNKIDTITGAVSVDSGISSTVGSLSNLSTPITSTIVAAINFLDSNAGDKTSLNTTNKNSLVAGINENKTRLDSINGGISNTMIRSDAIITSKILNNNVTFAKLPLATTAKRVIASTTAGAIYSEQQVDSDMIVNSAISAGKIQSNAITTVKIIDSAVSTSKIQLNAVTTAKILDLNVTSGKLANNAVTYAKMQTSSTANRVVGAVSAGSQLGEVQIQSAMIAAGAVDSAALKANVVTLGTKTTGEYVSTITAGTGVSFSAGAGTGAGSTPTIAIGQPVGTTSNVTFNDVVVSGNLTVSGTTTSINTETITLNDNIIVLNNNATGAASQDAGIEIERGTDSNVSILWNETTNRWTFTNSGTTLGPFYNIPTPNEYIDSATSKFPTTYTWTAGTTSGPTGSLTGNNLTAISFPAIPSAGASASGIITTGAQTIAGAKTFSSTISGSIDGSAATLTTGRNFSLTGVVTAPAVSFNGSLAVALATSFANQSVDSAALGNLSISTVKLQGNVVTNAKIALDTITANRLNSTVTLIIYNSAGTALKTLYGAGA